MKSHKAKIKKIKKSVDSLQFDIAVLRARLESIENYLYNSERFNNDYNR